MKSMISNESGRTSSSVSWVIAGSVSAWLAVASGCGSSSNGADEGQAETGASTSAGASEDDGEADAGEGTSQGDGTSGAGETGTDGADGADGSEGGSDTGVPDGVEVLELRGGGFTPPATETWYSCFSFQIQTEQLAHIVGFVPVVDSPIIHHYVLSIADGSVPQDPNEPCFEWPASILWAWAPGIEPMMLPDEAGFLIGDAPGGTHTLILQVHYNDPLLQGISDDNGIDVWITEDLRPNDAGVFSQGDVLGISIPPGETAYEHVASCSSAQTESLISEPINVFASFLHAHDIGAGIWTEVLRGGEVVGEMRDDDFDFDSQQFQAVDVQVEPGDELRTTCVYDSSERTETTPGGPGSEEEMCINFMAYYPKVQAEKCGSL